MDDNTLSTGLQGEELASRFLVEQGYRILERNYRGSRYEIDIVAMDVDSMVFCEVKTARTDRFGPSISWVTPSKTRHITQAAEEYIATHQTGDCSFRFDVIGLEVRKGKVKINHLKNAFIAPEDA